MRFRFTWKKQENRMNGRRQTRLRMLCFFMTAVLLCSGCGSIILNGNLEFSANAPIQPMVLEGREEQLAAPVFGYQNGDKYNVGEAKSAFAVLPGHLCPADVPSINEKIQEYNARVSSDKQLKQLRSDFKVIDYNENTGRFVYAYFTPYLKNETRYTDIAFPEIVNTGRSSNIPKNGSAKEFKPDHATELDELDGAVLVLMSYEPKSMDYTVFFSCYFTKDEIEANDNRCLAGMAGMDSGIDEDEVKDAGGMIAERDSAQSSGKNYYVYANDRLYLFNERGGKIFSSDYRAIVENKAREMCSRYGGFQHYRYTVSNVEMDGLGIPYITLNMEASNQPFSNSDQKAEEFVKNDQEYDEKDDNGEGDAAETVGDVTYFHGSFSCLRAPLTGTDGIAFRSYLSQDALKSVTDKAIVVTKEVHDYNKERRENYILVKPATSENDAEYRHENFEETLLRLKEHPDQANGFEEKTADELIVAYRKAVKGWMDTGFSEYSSGDDTIRYTLSGSSTGRIVPMYYNSNNAETTGPFRFNVNNTQYEHYYFFDWFSKTVYVNYDLRDLQSGMVGSLAYELNNRNLHLNGLKPGLYCGRDWAYYNIGGHTEKNSIYTVSGGSATLGHSQPLVSSTYFDHFDSRHNVNVFEENKELIASSNGALYFSNEKNPPGNNDSRFYGMRYYYNGTLFSDYSIGRGEYTSSFYSQNGYSQKFNSLAMLRNSLPFVLIRKESREENGKMSSSYLTVNNDNGDVYILPTQVMECAQKVDLEYQYILEDAGNDESEVFHSVKTSVMIPTEYKMEFPKGSYLELRGETWLGSNVRAGDTELNAITWYSVSGARLATDSIYSWTERAYFPIFDNASQRKLTTVGSTRVYGCWWWWYNYYYLTNEFWDFYYDSKDSYFSTLQIGRQGKDSPIYDRLVPGQAQDVGIWKVGNDNVVGYFTDQVIRFYKKASGSSIGSYRALAEVRVDELRALSTGYIMKEEESGAAKYDVVSQNSGRQSTDDAKSEVNVQMAEMGEEAMNEDESMYKLDSTNILPTDSSLKKFLYYSHDGGLYLLQLVSVAGAESWQKQGRIMSLMDGTYYRIFKGSGNTYKVVGFQTQDYSYTGADLCMAKVYDLDLSAIMADRGATAIDAYLDNLRNIYQIRTHTLRNTTDANGNVTVEIVKPDENDVEFVRARKLLTSDKYNDEVLPELKKVCQEYGLDSVPAETEAYLKNLRADYAAQRAAITEMYRFLGIDATKLEGNWRYLQFEGHLFNASYEALLEQTMIEIVLSGFYLDPKITPRSNGLEGMVGVHRYDPAKDTGDRVIRVTGAEDYVDEYAEYRKLYQEWQATTDEQQIMAAYTDEALIQRNQELNPGAIQGTLNEMIKNENSQLQGMDFYKAVSDDLEKLFYERLESGEIIFTGDE